MEYIKMSELDIVIYGAGAIGGSVGAWLAATDANVTFLDRPEIAEEPTKSGLTVYLENHKEDAPALKIPTITDLAQHPTANVVIVAVKNYSLDAVAKDIKAKLGDTPVIVALQNGVENQKILPKYFSKVLYGTICFNAWKDSNTMIGFNSWMQATESRPVTGQIYFGTVSSPDADLQQKIDDIIGTFNKAFAAEISPEFQNTIHTKMVTNLGNCVLTLVGHKFVPISSIGTLGRITSLVLLEGVHALQAAGYTEFPMQGITSWSLLNLSVKMPKFVSGMIFKKKVKKYPLNSMAQDIIVHKTQKSEIDFFNGYFIKLAKERGVPTPYNNAMYEICKVEFAKPDFKPLDVDDLNERIQAHIASH